GGGNAGGPRQRRARYVGARPRQPAHGSRTRVALSWNGGPWVADTSAWARASASPVAASWEATARAGDLVGCPVVMLELLFDARDAVGVERVVAALGAL